MKKILKISAITLAVIVMCLSFTGCAQLDDMKEHHAVWTQSGNASSITYNDTEYVLIENTNGDNPAYKETEELYVTEADVPVLLSVDKGTELNITTDGNFISGVVSDEYAESIDESYDVSKDTPETPNGVSSIPPSGFGKYVLYCKKDIYDEITATIESGIKYTDYGYSCWNYDNEENPYRYIYLDDEDAKLIDKAIDDAKLVDDSDYSIRNNCFSLGTLDHISEDKYFGKAMYDVYWLDMGVGEYYLSYIDDNGTERVYAVPQKYSKDFDSIFKEAKDPIGY